MERNLSVYNSSDTKFGTIPSILSEAKVEITPFENEFRVAISIVGILNPKRVKGLSIL